MSADTFVGTGLQSGFVVAVLIAAVLLANKLGGSLVLAQRACQVALGVALMMVVFSATAAFHGTPEILLAELDAMFDSEEQLLEAGSESAERNSEVGTIHVGLGIIFVVIGVVLLNKLSLITPALLLGGVLLYCWVHPPVQWKAARSLPFSACSLDHRAMRETYEKSPAF